MTTEQLYYQTLVRMNRLGTGVGLKLEPAVFVSLFNAQQTQWWRSELAERGDSIDREVLGSLLVVDKTLIPYKQDERVYRFTLPTDYYQLTGIQTYAHKDVCSRPLVTNLVSPQLATAYWKNPLEQPDFDWEETFGHSSGEDFVVYYKDFTIDSLLISYYKEPPAIDLPGYIKLDGSASSLVNSPLPDELLLSILSDMLQSLN